MSHFDSEKTRLTFTALLSLHPYLAGNFFSSHGNLFLQATAPAAV
jgi:hypothetical protein